MSRVLTRKLTFNKALDRYVKKIDGKVHYFGPKGGTQQEALRELDAMIRERDEQIAGLATNNIPLATLAENYARDCESKMQAGKLKLDSWKEYERAIQTFIDHVGARVRVAELRPAQFRAVRAKWDAYAPTTIARYVRAVRTMFQWGYDSQALASLPRWAKEFEVPEKSEYRNAKERAEDEHGERRFTDDELRKILRHPLCDGWLRACVLLGLNAGFYAKDCSDLLWGEIKQIEGVWCVDREREKTSVSQRAPLWPETLKLIETLRLPGMTDTDRVFRTPTGRALVNRDTRNDYLSSKFDLLRKATAIARYRVGFGSFRHTHVTAVGDCGDDNAARRVSGHEIQDVRGHYDKVTIARLQKVTDLARQRLYDQILNVPTGYRVGRSRAQPH